VAALADVDAVVIFPRLYVCGRSSAKFVPYVHAKGTDYTARTVPERDEVAAVADEWKSWRPLRHSHSELIRSR